IITVVSIFLLNSSWGNFLWPYLIIKNPELYTISVKLFSMKEGGYSADMYLIAVVFAIIPPIILFAIFQKQMMSGMSIGSGVKG
ncbi:MAG: carbohydrate ABC transporter permease, partial [Oscillospiraceae bacterium]